MEFLLDLASLANSTLRISTPLVFAAMAGIFAERSGVIDFSLEGKMLMAAFVAAVGSYYFGNPWIGLLMAIVMCVSLSMLHGFASVTHKGDQSCILCCNKYINNWFNNCISCCLVWTSGLNTNPYRRATFFRNYFTIC